MSAKDKYHEHVKEALIKDGWEITHDPYELEVEGTTYEVDLGAEKLFAAQKGKDKILVEVKSFLRASIVYEFHAVLGQFMIYRRSLEKENIDRILYVAVSKDIYERILQIPAISFFIDDFNVKLIVFEIGTKEILTWIQ